MKQNISNVGQMADVFALTPLVSVKDAATKTGLSQKAIRKGCADGVIPHVWIGRTIRVNLPLLLDYINEVSCVGGDMLSE